MGHATPLDIFWQILSLGMGVQARSFLHGQNKSQSELCKEFSSFDSQVPAAGRGNTGLQYGACVMYPMLTGRIRTQASLQRAYGVKDPYLTKRFCPWMMMLKSYRCYGAARKVDLAECLHQLEEFSGDSLVSLSDLDWTAPLPVSYS